MNFHASINKCEYISSLVMHSSRRFEKKNLNVPSLLCAQVELVFFLHLFVITAICYYLCTQDLLDALNQLEVGLKENLKKLSSFDKYKQQVLLGHLDWSPMHKDPSFWRENINNFEENDFQVCLVLS